MVPTGERDFAVVIGISRAPRLTQLPTLAGAAVDARLFAQWLVDEGLPPSHLRLLTSESTPTAAERPSYADVSQAFTDIRRAAAEGGARRLYIYMTGHGLGVDVDEVALFTADASFDQPQSIIGAKAYADYFQGSGIFEEIVLFVDCARALMQGPWTTTSPPLIQPRLKGQRIPPAYLYGFATAHGAIAYEAVQPDTTTGAHGFFTSALLSGLRGAAASVDGSITSQSLASYVASRVRELSEERQQPPVFAIDPSRQITFRQPVQSAADAPAANPPAFAAQSKAPPRSAAITAYPTPRIASDHWATRDALGYAAFARTVATLITHKETVPPLTIGIKAPWGAGKTSLMKRIQYLLDGTAAITEENEAARRNRDLEIGMTLKQLLAGLRALTQPDEAANPAAESDPLTRLTDRVRALLRRSPKSPVRQPVSTPAAAVPGEEATRRDERFMSIWQLLQRAAAIVSNAARHLPSVQFTPPAAMPSPDGTAAGIDARVTVWFNAWKYQTSEQIWAGLAHCIISQVTARMTPASRELFWLRLHASRVDVGEVRWKARRLVLREVIPLLFFCVLVLIGSILALSVGLVTLGRIGILLSTVTTIAGTWYRRSRKLGEKVSDEFRELVREPDYEGKLGFLHLVESDIRDVLDIVATPTSPLIVFVDDLDRCAPHSVAEVVEAINLFLSGDYPNCIFVLGMEPSIVAAALEVANKDLLEKLQAFGIGDSHVPLGWRFMEKIIQLPLSIPAPDGTGSKAYLEYLTGASSTTPPEAPKIDRVAEYVQQFQGVASVDEVVQKTDGLLASAPADQKPAIVEASKRVYSQTFTERDPAMSRFVEETITLFQGNPRQMKRYVNLFRFMSTLRHSVSIDRAGSGNVPGRMPSDEALAKFIALSVHWPQAADYFRLARQLDDGKSAPDRTALLGKLEAGAVDLAREQDPDAADLLWIEYLKVLGLEGAGWARARDFRTFLARGESLADYNQSGLW